MRVTWTGIKGGGNCFWLLVHVLRKRRDGKHILEEEVSGSRVQIFGIEVVLVAWDLDSKSSLIVEGRLCTESQGTATERMALTAAALRLFAAAEERVDAEREAPRC